MLVSNLIPFSHFSLSLVQVAPTFEAALCKCHYYIADEFLQLSQFSIHPFNTRVLLLHSVECIHADNYIWAVCQNVMM